MMGPAFFGYLPLGLAPPLLSPAGPRGGLGVYPSALGQRPAQHQYQHASTRFFSLSVDRDRLDFVVVLPTTNIVGRWFLIDASDWLFIESLCNDCGGRLVRSAKQLIDFSWNHRLLTLLVLWYPRYPLTPGPVGEHHTPSPPHADGCRCEWPLQHNGWVMLDL